MRIQFSARMPDGNDPQEQTALDQTVPQGLSC